MVLSDLPRFELCCREKSRWHIDVASRVQLTIVPLSNYVKWWMSGFLKAVYPFHGLEAMLRWRRLSCERRYYVIHAWHNNEERGNWTWAVCLCIYGAPWQSGKMNMHRKEATAHWLGLMKVVSKIIPNSIVCSKILSKRLSLFLSMCDRLE